jgi:hypothetical protein
VHRVNILAKDRCCSFPNLRGAGYLCEARRVNHWAHTHVTDINDA